MVYANSIANVNHSYFDYGKNQHISKDVLSFSLPIYQIKSIY